MAVVDCRVEREVELTRLCVFPFFLSLVFIGRSSTSDKNSINNSNNSYTFEL